MIGGMTMVCAAARIDPLEALQVPVTLELDVTGLALSPGSLTVTNASDGGTLEAVGEDAPALTYAVQGDAAGLVSVNGLSVSAGPAVLALRDRYMQANVSTNATWEVEVPWVAKYKGVAVTNDVAKVTVVLKLSAKVRDDCECDCAEGTTAEAGCVAFRQRFGRTPGLAGMPVGALAIEAEALSDGLFTPGALRYDHPMMRRLDVATWVVTDPMGRAVTYGRDGFPVGADVAADSRLEALPDGTVREVFADRSEVIYGATGEVAALVSPAGVRATPGELGIAGRRGGGLGDGDDRFGERQRGGGGHERWADDVHGDARGVWQRLGAHRVADGRAWADDGLHL